MGVSTNSTLTLNNENNGMVVITSRNCNNPVVPQNPFLTNYVFRCRYGGEPAFVTLTPDQVRLMEYLKDRDWLNDDCDFDEVGNCEFEKI